MVKFVKVSYCKFINNKKELSYQTIFKIQIFYKYFPQIMESLYYL